MANEVKAASGKEDGFLIRFTSEAIDRPWAGRRWSMTERYANEVEAKRNVAVGLIRETSIGRSEIISIDEL